MVTAGALVAVSAVTCFCGFAFLAGRGAKGIVGCGGLEARCSGTRTGTRTGLEASVLVGLAGGDGIGLGCSGMGGIAPASMALRRRASFRYSSRELIAWLGAGWGDGEPGGRAGLAGGWSFFGSIVDLKTACTR